MRISAALRVHEMTERLAVIAEALDAADVALARARARNVPRTRLPRSIERLGPLGALVLRVYNTLFIAQREVATDQTDALVAVVNAMREVVRSQQALHRENESPRA